MISDEININIGEYFVASGKRLVDMKEVFNKEFIKKYPFTLPEDFETANFYFETPTELGLKYNEVENGYIRCLGKDGKSILQVYFVALDLLAIDIFGTLMLNPKKLV